VDSTWRSFNNSSGQLKQHLLQNPNNQTTVVLEISQLFLEEVLQLPHQSQRKKRTETLRRRCS
jgi:uncharacterized cupin superfamily protein